MAEESKVPSKVPDLKIIQVLQLASLDAPRAKRHRQVGPLADPPPSN